MANDLRDYLTKTGGFITLENVQSNPRTNFVRVERTADWEKVSNFFSGSPERSDLMKQLTVCILQLQAEVDRLRKAQG